MAEQSKVQQLQERIQEALDSLGRSLEQLFNPDMRRPKAVPIPIPVDQRPQRRVKGRYSY